MVSIHATCDMCGNDFTEWDYQNSFGFSVNAGYGSKYDGQHIHIDLCARCFDRIMDSVLPQCPSAIIKDVIDEYEDYEEEEDDEVHDKHGLHILQ